MSYFGGGGGSGSIVLNGVQSCNFRQNKRRDYTFMNAMDSVYDGRRDNPWNLEMIWIFTNIYTMYNTGEPSEPEISFL